MARPVPDGDLAMILAETASLWEEVRGKRVFITGGTGFFGCWLVESFCHANREMGLGASITVLTRDAAKFAAKCPQLAGDLAVTLHAGDVRDFEFPAGDFAYVIHAATEASAKQAAEEPREMLSTMLAGTERTLKFASRCGAKKFLLTSSGAVYGTQPSEMVHVPETYAGAPDSLSAKSVYAEGKRASELMCALYADQFECKIARCWAFCGPHLPLDTHFAIGNFIADGMAGRTLAISGDGTPTRSYMYSADLAVWLWTILFAAPSMRAYNVGSSESVSILELAQRVRDALRPDAKITVAKEAVEGMAVARYVPDATRAERELGLRVTIGLDETIRRTAAWYGWKGETGGGHEAD